MSKPNLSMRIENSVYELLQSLAESGFAESTNAVARKLLYSKIKEEYGLELPVSIFDKMTELESRLETIEKQLADLGLKK